MKKNNLIILIMLSLSVSHLFSQGIIEANQILTDSIKITDGAADGKILTSDENGNASWGNLLSEELLQHDPEIISISEELGRTYNLINEGNLIYLLGEDAFSILDISNIKKPKIISQLALFPDIYLGLVKTNTHAFIVGRDEAHLMSIDISDPTSPFFQDTLDLISPIADIAIKDTIIYTACHLDDSIRTINISDPANLIQIASLGLNNSYSSIVVEENYAYLSARILDELHVVDISNPSAPSFVTSLVVGDAPWEIAIDQNIACIVNNLGVSLSIVDISDPTMPLLLNEIGVGNSGEIGISVDIQNNYAFVANIVASSLHIIDISEPSSPVAVDTIALPEYGRRVRVNNKYAFLANNKLDPTTILSILRLNNTQLNIDNSGNFYTSSDDDTDPSNELSDLQLDGNILKLSCPLTTGNEIDLSPYLDNTEKWSMSGSDVYYNSGNVGIGTDNPLAQLHVDSIGLIGDIPVGDQSVAQDSTNLGGKGFLTTPWIYTNAIESATERGTGSTLIALGNLNNFSNDDEIRMVTLGESRLTVKSNGRVGIGTTSPTHKLEVVGSTALDSATLFVSGGLHQVGIGTQDPIGKLTVVDTTRNTLVLKTLDNDTETGIAFQNSGLNYTFSMHRDNNSDMVFSLGSTADPDNLTDYFFFEKNGRFGLGVDAPTHPLELVSGAHVTAAGVWTDASDRAKKYNIQPLHYGLDEILRLSPKSYNYKIDDSESIGFIAQEIELLIPEVVSGEEGSMGVAYGQLTAVLVNAIKELKAENDALKQENALLGKIAHKNKADIAELTSVLNSLIQNSEE